MGQLKIDNPEKLATQGTEDDEKKIHVVICLIDIM
jgi:hypothetical protein